jgi:hypothetical protein
MARDGKMVFMPVFLQNVAANQPWDVRQPDSIAPNNMVFVLGHLAAHIKAPPPVPKEGRGDLLSMGSSLFDRLAGESSADIQGWNDVVDAATQQNGGKPPTGQQTAYLLMSLRYRAVFFNSLKNAKQKVAVAPSGRIEPTQDNINALMAALAITNLFDFD